MEALIFLVVVLIIFAAIKAKSTTSRSNSRYYSRNPMTEIEQVAYWRLVDAFGQEKIVLAQVAFSSFIGTKGGSRKENFSKFATARQKVADFVICNKDSSIYAIVEVDDKSHDREKDKIRDAITEEAGIKTFRIEAKALPSVDELREAIK